MFENVLVTGGAGRLGRHVCRRLASKRKVTSLDLAAPENDPFARSSTKNGTRCPTQ